MDGGYPAPRAANNNNSNKKTATRNRCGKGEVNDDVVSLFSNTLSLILGVLKAIGK